MLVVPGAVDVHCHVLDPTLTAVAGASYALFEAGPERYRAHLDALGVERGVLVTASAHGTDNAPLRAALRADPARLRGIAVVTPEVGDAELDALHADGVRGVRLQDNMPGGASVDHLERMGERLDGRGWHVELWATLTPELGERVARCPVPVVLDHFGYLPADRGPEDPSVRMLVELARGHDAWVTMSGAYRLAPDLPPEEAGRALEERVGLLVDAAPERLLWASDWPYVAPPRERPRVDEQVRERERWLPGAGLRTQVLLTNPARCYDFTEPAVAEGG